MNSFSDEKGKGKFYLVTDSFISSRMYVVCIDRPSAQSCVSLGVAVDMR